MSGISEANKRLARTVTTVFGGNPRVNRYWDDHHKSFVDLLSSVDRPQEGVVSYSTLGLSDHPLYLPDGEYGVRVELVGACGSNFKNFDNILATAAFCVINSKWFCSPGAVFPDILKMYDASETMEHLFFTAPFLWEDRLKTIDLGEKTVAWLMIVPISDHERRVAEEAGPKRLEEIFSEAQIDIFDLNRPSVVS